MMTDMFLQIDNSKAWKYAFALTGRRLSIHFIPRVSLRFTLGYALLRFQRDKRKSWVKWQPAFRLVKVVFVVVNRQHRVQNQTVVPVVSVVVKTKAQNILLLSTLLRLQRAWTIPNYTQGVATLYPGLCAGCPFGALLLIFVHQTVHP